MMPFCPPPRWLPLHLLLGGVVASALLRMQAPPAPWSVPASGLWRSCGASLIVLITALLLAATMALAVGLAARRLGPLFEKMAGLLGRALVCLPVVALVWGFAGIWIGSLGWPVETLMPAQLPVASEGALAVLARGVWEFLAPALVLAIPLLGEILHVVVTDGDTTVDLECALRARGVAPAERLWRHHLSQLLPVLRVRLQSLCLIAPVYLIVIEDALRFMGWGGWMAHSMRDGDVGGIASGFLSGAVIMALLCGGLTGLSGPLRVPRNRLTVLAWQPWSFWALGFVNLPPFSSSPWLVLWFAVLLSGASAWHQAWTSIERGLPLAASKVLGASEVFTWWKHLAGVQTRTLVAWSSAAFAQTMLWISVACALHPRLVQELAAPLASWFDRLVVDSPDDTSRILADPSVILQAGGGLALAALCLVQFSRIVQPRPS